MDGNLRTATRADIPQILELIRALAEYEREPGAVRTGPDDLDRALFTGDPATGGQPAAYCHVAEDRENPGRLLGIALWFLTFSTWTGRHGIYLEDLFVRPEARGSGFGAALLRTLAALCVERGYTRLEWTVLDWNTPALAFYRNLGAVPMGDWTVQRVDGDALRALAAG